MSNNFDQILLPPTEGEDHFLRQPANMSEVFYSRNCIDPLMSAEPTPQERRQIVQYSDQAAEIAIKTGKTSEAIEFSLDALYRAQPLESADSIIHRINRVVPLIIKQDKGSIAPDKHLDLEMHLIDLFGLQQFVKVNGHGQNIDPTTKANALATMESVCVQQVIKGSKLLQHAKETHDSLTDEDARKGLRGKMFELFFVTHKRRLLFAEERYDREIYLSTTDFEDSSSAKFLPNHNYDIVSFDHYGMVDGLFQCKNARSNEAYDERINKVQGRAFFRFMEDPKLYIYALQMLIDSDINAAVPEETLEKCHRLLWDLLEEKAEEVRLGELALR